MANLDSVKNCADYRTNHLIEACSNYCLAESSVTIFGFQPCAKIMLHRLKNFVAKNSQAFQWRPNAQVPARLPYRRIVIFTFSQALLSFFVNLLLVSTSHPTWPFVWISTVNQWKKATLWTRKLKLLVKVAKKNISSYLQRSEIISWWCRNASKCNFFYTLCELFLLLFVLKFVE